MPLLKSLFRKSPQTVVYQLEIRLTELLPTCNHFGSVFSHFRVTNLRIAHYPSLRNFGPQISRTDFGDGGANLYQTSGHDSPVIFAGQLYVVMSKNCTVLYWWPPDWVCGRQKRLKTAHNFALPRFSAWLHQAWRLCACYRHSAT